MNYLLNLFEFNTNTHRLKLKIQKFKASVRSHFLPNGVFSEWNGLSEEIVNTSNPNIFKNKLDAHFDDEADRFPSRLQFYWVILNDCSRSRLCPCYYIFAAFM
jgi:hypothetical protein